MPIDPARILAIVHELELTSADDLKEMDRELLLSIRRTVEELKRDVDKILLRLSFLDEQKLN